MGAGELQIETRQLEATTVIEVRGEVDLATVGELVRTAEQAVPRDSTLELDLRAVDFMDSAGVAAVNRIRRLTLEHETTLVLRCTVGGPVAQLVEWTGLDRVIDVRLEAAPASA